jgi:hypothetical protein
MMVSTGSNACLTCGSRSNGMFTDKCLDALSNSCLSLNGSVKGSCAVGVVKGRAAGVSYSSVCVKCCSIGCGVGCSSVCGWSLLFGRPIAGCVAASGMSRSRYFIAAALLVLALVNSSLVNHS